MSNPPKSKTAAEPTNAELEILQVLWEFGPSTVRFVHEKLTGQKKEVQYTSTLKQMQVMTEKGLLTRDESQMKHVYTPAEKEKDVKSRFLNKFVHSFYQGSASQLVLQLLGEKKTSKKEIQAIKEMLKNLD
ncbi:MAG: BlaI/MecI/CopY family transcriptional regulator [Chitinophagaceae bacterium]|nr:BlaI/MecI/CopY family transcriptional regulator [Chitinophagaceae bacterium]